MPGLGAGRGAAVHQGGARIERTPVRDLPGVVAGRGVLLVRRVVLLVHDHQAQPRERREHGAAGAQHHVGVAGCDAPVLGGALSGCQRRVPHGHALAQSRPQAPQQLRREGDLGHQHQRRQAALPRHRDGPQVHLALAGSRDPVQQQGLGGARADGPRDATHRGRLLVGEHGGLVGRGRRAEPVEAAGILALGHQGDVAVVGQAANGGHGGARKAHQVGRGQGAPRLAQVGQHRRTAPLRLGSAVHHARNQPLATLARRCAQAPRAVGPPAQGALGPRGQHQPQACTQGGKRAGRHPPGEADQLTGHHGGVDHSGNGSQRARVRGGVAAHHDAQHGTGTQSYGNEGPGDHAVRQVGGHGVVERPVEGAGGDEGDDLGGRPPVRRISQPARPRWPCSPR